MADNLLSEILYPFAEELITQNIISRYFFIRYADPDFHIRFRLKFKDELSFSKVFKKMHGALAPLVSERVISKLMCDTYKRELERYGAENIDLTESIFHIDSKAIMEIIHRISLSPTLNHDEIRWNTSLILLDDMLSAANYTLDDKDRIMHLIATNFKEEFNFTSHSYTKQLNDKYRRERNKIEKLLSERNDWVEAFSDILEERRALLSSLFQAIADINLHDSLLSSLQHMTMNRLFRSKNRQHELVIYDFLSKYYKSRNAIQMLNHYEKTSF